MLTGIPAPLPPRGQTHALHNRFGYIEGKYTPKRRHQFGVAPNLERIASSINDNIIADATVDDDAQCVRTFGWPLNGVATQGQVLQQYYSDDTSQKTLYNVFALAHQRWREDRIVIEPTQHFQAF